MSSFLLGPNVSLLPMDDVDMAESISRWNNDPEVTFFLERGMMPLSVDESRKNLSETRAKQGVDIEFKIAMPETKKVIGVAGLHSTKWVARSTEFRILIGEKDHWGKGYGTEVLEMLCAYAFERLNLNKVWLGVNADNKRAHKSYLKAGFKDEGCLREEVYRNGRYYDVLRLSLLRDEYEKIKNEWKSFDKVRGQLLDSQ